MKKENYLVTENIKLVYYVINKYYSWLSDDDDIISAGFLGLVNASRTFDETKGFKFSSFATTCIINSIKGEISKRLKEVNTTSLNDSASKELDGVDLIELIADDYDLEDNFDYIDLKSKVSKCIDILNETEKKVIYLYFGFNGKQYTKNEISNIVGISYAKVNNALSLSIRKLRREIKIKQLIKKIDF